MTDAENIIMRLRNDSAPGQDVNLGILPSVIDLMRDAANEIERLQDLLKSRDDFLVSKDLFSEYVETITQ